MSTKLRTNKATRALAFTKIMAGIVQHVTTAILLGGTSMTQAALTAIYQAAIQAQSDLDAARSLVNAKVQAHKAALAVADTTTTLLHAWAVSAYGPKSTVLEDFGFEPAAPADKPVAVKAASAAKATATRKAKKAALAAVGAPTAATAPAPAAPAATPAAAPAKA
jgi:hypothetical protein